MDDMLCYVDVQGALGRVRGNKKLYRRMLGMFLDSKEFDKMEDALAADDVETAADVAHAIKGMTGNLSLTALFDVSTELLNGMRTGTRDSDTIERYRRILEKTLEQVREISQSLDAEL